MSEVNKALDWIENLIKAHEDLMSNFRYSDEIYCYTIPGSKYEIPIENLEKLVNEAGLGAYMTSFGKPGEYPEYEGKLVCPMGKWELYELIRKEEVNE